MSINKNLNANPMMPIRLLQPEFYWLDQKKHEAIDSALAVARMGSLWIEFKYEPEFTFEGHVHEPVLATA